MAHYDLGLTLHDKSDLDGAIKELCEALSLAPDFGDALSNIVSAHLVTGDLDGAIAECREVLRLKTDNVNAHYVLANLLEKQGDLTSALEEYRSACSLAGKGSYMCGAVDRLAGKLK